MALRLFARYGSAALRRNMIQTRSALAATSGQFRMSSHGPQETDDEFDARYVTFFNRADIDGWEIRKAVNDLVGMDLVPEPKIINAALRACRRVNDYALTVRMLEAIQMRAETNKDIWPYVLQEIQPTLTELGISTPAELGYDKPELALKSVFDMHG